MSGKAGGMAVAGTKVLVIDDSNTIRRSAEIFLTQAGCAVLLAEDGFEALGTIVEREPELIFCDIMMPRLDGYQTCSLLKQHPRYSDIPFILLSSKNGVFDRMRGAMVGATDYLTKPFTRESLLSVVQRFAETRKTTSA
jgi:twitching motility two-component system response regulator PilG